ncbi:MAG: hypothetical protein ACREDY_01910 [Bradyrhizobium sp.]
MRRTHGSECLWYSGIDLFELSPADETSKLSLKAAHCMLKPTGARVRLVPGDPFTALAAAANTIGASDVIVIAAGHDAESLRRAWFYIPRMLHPATQVFVERSDGGTIPPVFQVISHDEIRRRALASMPHRTAA